MKLPFQNCSSSIFLMVIVVLGSFFILRFPYGALSLKNLATNIGCGSVNLLSFTFIKFKCWHDIIPPGHFSYLKLELSKIQLICFYSFKLLVLMYYLVLTVWNLRESPSYPFLNTLLSNLKSLRASISWILQFPFVSIILMGHHLLWPNY